MKFYLGTHMVNWLKETEVPLFISHRRLDRLKMHKHYSPKARWCLDSGGFTELSLHGRWTTTPKQYVSAIHRYNESVGNMDWAAPQDAMCEPWILEKSKGWLGGTVEAHQLYTVENFLELRDIAPHIPFIPTLQGWDFDDYHAHIDLYASYGVDLASYPTVGLGSVCRRQSTDEIGTIVKSLHAKGLRLHGFGVKMAGVVKYGNYLVSADSMAWSYGGRNNKCNYTQRVSCANCLHYALEWRNKLFGKAEKNGVTID